VLSREQARRTKADADLKELDRDERLRALVRGDKVEEALAESLRMHARIIDQIPTRATECRGRHQGWSERRSSISKAVSTRHTGRSRRPIN
jgi:hypothetical protein